MSYSGMNRDVRQILQQLDKLGCEISRSGGGHWRVTRPGRQAIIVSHSSSDHRALRNIKADAKRYLGLSL